MQKKLEQNKKSYDGIKGRVAVIVSNFNSEISNGLLKGLEEVFEKQKCVQWQVHNVPGAFEIPLMAQRLACMVKVESDDSDERFFDVIVALGCIVKGDTYHFELVSNECARGCMKVMLEQDIPVVFEVLACYDHDDAVKRSYGEENKGKSAAYVALDYLSSV